MPSKALFLFDKQSVENHQADPVAFLKLMQEQPSVVEYDYAYIEDFVCILDHESSAFFVNEENGKIIDLVDFEVIYFRRWGKVAAFARAIAIYAKHVGIKVIDQEVVPEAIQENLQNEVE